MTTVQVSLETNDCGGAPIAQGQGHARRLIGGRTQALNAAPNDSSPQPQPRLQPH
eukprot:CAMPEP_0119356618 /NCGR_PEP_ID=MMETSP1334-20130426/5179_1 /TAXON_ID=127549 /ORGANISM="Calcidiscus leptoporus, Strain RCC1130" /LENGTH=54 /DNA_ID=CAMNT_0007370693 /DNA_START=200 /DNA_END=364 /DNA_ORIENTATION=-